MKKYLSSFLMFCLLVIFAAGCAKNDTSLSDSSTHETPENSAPESMAVDVDLTLLSSTMVYAEVYNIMMNPTQYIGKTIKINGPYYAQYFDETGLFYHYVIIEDATACCAQGLEFIWNGEHIYPDDYPEDQTRIEVIGVFDSYEELDETWYYLAVNDISIKK